MGNPGRLDVDEGLGPWVWKFVPVCPFAFGTYRDVGHCPEGGLLAEAAFLRLRDARGFPRVFPVRIERVYFHVGVVGGPNC